MNVLFFETAASKEIQSIHDELTKLWIRLSDVGSLDVDFPAEKLEQLTSARAMIDGLQDHLRNIAFD
jgi:hypothetical protein